VGGRHVVRRLILDNVVVGRTSREGLLSPGSGKNGTAYYLRDGDRDALLARLCRPLRLIVALTTGELLPVSEGTAPDGTETPDRDTLLVDRLMARNC
jgi:hypothetical protein